MNFCHSKLKITQTSVFLDLLKTILDGHWNLRVHKSQCFMNDQLLCGKRPPIYTEATG